jgi:hypothetical protein
MHTLFSWMDEKACRLLAKGNTRAFFCFLPVSRPGCQMEVQSRSILVSAGAGAPVVDCHGSYYAGKTSMASWVMRQNAHSSCPY